MSILAQCGHGRGDKIERALDAGSIQGVIMSPRDEGEERLRGAVQLWEQDYPQATVLFDPQFYAATLSAPRDGHLGEYDYYAGNSGLSRTQFSPSRLRRYVEQCLDYQHNTLGSALSYLVSPTILFDDFRDHWSQVGLNMAMESADHHAALTDPAPLLVSVVVSETALQSLEGLDEFLDALTELEVAGFYLIVRRNSGSPQLAMEAPSFGRLLYMCYVLSDINQYEVVVGYTDWQSFMLGSVGVTHTACGWYQNLRQFSLARFQPSRGGRRPRPRYSSVPLLSSPLLIPELEDIHLAGELSRVLSGTSHDGIIAGGPIAGASNWTDPIACLAHWEALSHLSQRVRTHGSTPSRLQESLNLIRAARNLYSLLENYGINFDPATGPSHLPEWEAGLGEFRAIAGV